LAAGLVDKSGAHYALCGALGDQRLGQGRETAAQALEADPALLQRLVAMLTRSAHQTADAPPPPSAHGNGSHAQPPPVPAPGA
jgi:hypothetical protein